MNKISVSTKEELNQAKENGYDEIIVTGELANKLKKSKKVALLSGAAAAALIAAVGLAPITGGLSMVGMAGAAALTGVEVATIITASAIGLALVFAIYKEYDEISYKDGELKFRKKSKKKSK